MTAQLKEQMNIIVSQIPCDNDYSDKIEELNAILHGNDNFDFVECTLEITTKKKGRVISIYDQNKYEDWLDKIIELPDEWDLSKLFYKQKLYCRIYLDKYEYHWNSIPKNESNLKKGYTFICIDQAVAKKYPCECLKECTFRNDTLGIKPYKDIYFYNPLSDEFYIKAPEYYWISPLNFCPCCGVKIENNHASKNTKTI